MGIHNGYPFAMHSPRFKPNSHTRPVHLCRPILQNITRCVFRINLQDLTHLLMKQATATGLLTQCLSKSKQFPVNIAPFPAAWNTQNYRANYPLPADCCPVLVILRVLYRLLHILLLPALYIRGYSFSDHKCSNRYYCLMVYVLQLNLHYVFLGTKFSRELNLRHFQKIIANEPLSLTFSKFDNILTNALLII